MRVKLCRRLPWVSITPFGIPVEPEVYWRKASVLLSTAGSRHASARLLAISSVVMSGIPCSSWACANKLSTIDERDEMVSTTDGCTSFMMLRNLARLRLVRVCGGYVGTAITPAYRQPEKATINSKSAG